MSIDADFKVELFMLEELCGQSSEDRLLVALLELFPSRKNRTAVESVLQQVNMLKNKDVFEFSSRAAQGKMENVENILMAITDAREPKLGEYSDDRFLRNLIPRLAYFVRHEEPNSTVKVQDVLFGADA